VERDDRTQLIARDRLTAEAARRQEFPTALRGLDRQAVENFQRRAASELHEREREVADLSEELQKLRAENAGLAVSRPDTGGSGVDVLTRATLQADKIISDAQAEAHRIIEEARAQHEQIIAEAGGQRERIIGEARKQGGGIVGRATMEAEREAGRIKREAPAEAQRAVAHYTSLAAAVRAGIIADLDSLSEQLQKWKKQAQGPGGGSQA
jgi:cell division septum initiation protein DivIVA